MDLDLAQIEWTLGRYALRTAELPELAAQMMMQGFEGPAILELVSFHQPYLRDLPEGLVERAFLESGRPPLSVGQASLKAARRICPAILDGTRNPVEGAKAMLCFMPWGEEDVDLSFFYQLDELVELWDGSRWGRRGRERQIIEIVREFIAL